MKATIETVGQKIVVLADSERITKALLSELSREVLEVVMLDEGKDTGKGTEDSRTINDLINVLTPVNKRAAIVFFKHFSPFVVATNEQGEFHAFGKKDKKNWGDKIEEVKEFLADPHNNIWSWAERNIEVEQKPFDVKKVTKTIENSIKKAGMKATLEAVFAGGLTLENILEIMNPQEEGQE